MRDYARCLGNALGEFLFLKLCGLRDPAGAFWLLLAWFPVFMSFADREVSS